MSPDRTTEPVSTDLATLQSFVPDPLLDWLGRVGAPVRAPVSEEVEFVVWMADLVTFTPLSEEIAQTDHRRTEAVKDVLNEFFERATDAVRSRGGHVLRFMGDAVLAIWTIEAGANQADRVADAVQCALDVQATDISTGLTDRPVLEMRVGVGVGRGTALQVGGVDDRWEYLVAGPPFVQLSKALASGRADDVMLSREAWELVSDRAMGMPQPEGVVRLMSLDDRTTPTRPPARDMPEHLRDEMRQFVDETVIEQFTDVRQMAGFRSVVSMFINLPSVDASTELGRNRLQSAVEATQRALTRYGGTLNRVAVDEKGTTVIAVFGLLRAHPEDAYRAVLAATEIDADLQALQMERGIGIATGQTFCGAYGNDGHRDYTMIGPSANLAARFMTAERNRILCDGTTARDCRKKIHFQALEPKMVKGFEEPVQVFTPLWKYDMTDPALSAVEDSLRATLIGRTREHGVLLDRLSLLRNDRISSVVILEGEAGYGKSALGADLVELARAEEATTLVGSAEPVEPGPPFHAWRSILEQLFGLATVPFKDRRRELILEKLAYDPETQQRAPLLNAVLDLEFQDNETTRLISGSNRRDAVIELLVGLLARIAADSPLLILLDDAHWCDSASWALARAAARKVQPLMLVLLTRPIASRPPELDELLEDHDAAVITVGAMSDAEAIELAKFRLGASSLSAEVEELILTNAEGHPFLIEEFAYSLLSSDAFQVSSQGEGVLVDDVEQLAFTGTSHGIVVSRLDQLDEDEKRTLSTAAVIGRSFDLPTLAAVHPDSPEAGELERQLVDLENRGVTSTRSDGTYSFVHQITREAAYEQLPYENRRDVHRAIAIELESRTRTEIPHELLAHHWRLANEPVKTLGHLEASASRALRRGTNREAIDFHQRSLQLVDTTPGFEDLDPLRRSQWLVEIGQAHGALGQLRRAEEAYYEALDVLDVHVPTTTAGKIGRLLREGAKQIVHIAVPRLVRSPTDENERVRLGQAARISALIGEVYYFVADLLGFPLLNLISINLGEKAGQPIVSGLAYSSTAYLVGTARLRRLAMRYFRRARLAEEYEFERGFVQSVKNFDIDEMGPGHLIAVALSESSYYLTFNQWEKGLPIVTEGLQRCRQLGDQYSAGIAMSIRGFGSYLTGRLSDTVGQYDELLKSAQARANHEHEAWAAAIPIPAALGMEQVGPALLRAGEAAQLLDVADPLTIPIIHGTRAQALLHRGRHTDARLSAEAALAATDRTPIYIRLAGIAGMLETFLTLWHIAEEAGNRSEARELEALSKKGLSIARSFALVLPFARPKYRWFAGRVAVINGKTPRARRMFRKGLEIASAAGLTWDQGLLHLELAATYPAGSEERATHFDAARQHLGTVGSSYDLRRLADIGR